MYTRKKKKKRRSSYIACINFKGAISSTSSDYNSVQETGYEVQQQKTKAFPLTHRTALYLWNIFYFFFWQACVKALRNISHVYLPTA